jgi:GNAT superfamily N-acetyltransferase
MGELISRGRSGAQGEFGSAIPVRPATEDASRCLRGHLLTLAGGKGNWSHYYRLRVTGCRLCATLELEDKSARNLADWCLIDPANQYDVATAPVQGLVLVRVPPVVRAAPGRLELRLDGQVLADADVSLCPVEKRAVFEHVRVDAEYRRLGYGRVLVAAALILGRGYDWSMTAISESTDARAFWATVGLPGPDTPAYCSHMAAAAEKSP